MLNFVRRLKPAYALYNLFHPTQLKHNVPSYKLFGMKKKYFSPVSSKDFEHLPKENLSTSVDMAALLTHPAFTSLSPENQQSVLDFDKNGFVILKRFFSPEEVDEINLELEKLLESDKVNFKYGNKIMFAIYASELLRKAGEKKQLLDLLSLLMGREAVLFQSINFINGSQQKTHSDSIHMTTYPLGGLIASWLALEDVSAEQGALHYYPGSHKLPYYLNKDYGNEGNSLVTGSKTYGEYEIFMAKKIEELKLEKQVFVAAKGDLLIWHANLFHGGEPHTNKAKTRKSMVFHYFAKNVVCYHEITQRPALIRNS